MPSVAAHGPSLQVFMHRGANAIQVLPPLAEEDGSETLILSQAR